MKIIIAETAGFCMGVRRAVDLAVDHSAESERILTLGPLIHNRQTVEMLRERGVETLDEENPPESASTILVRAHGVPPELRDAYARKGHRIIDGTCPKVRTVHRVIERFRSQGYEIVITGDEGHAEVIGLMGVAGEAGHLIHCPEDVGRLPDLKKVCLVSQTTFDRELFDDIAQLVTERFDGGDVVVKKTICSATDKRQEETKRLASQVDAMIVVGGKHSANTLRLAKISAQHAPIAQHVETEQEIDWQPLAGCRTVGITAGASTPSWMIKRVADHLKFQAQIQHRSLPNVFGRILDFAANLNVIVALGGVALYYASCYLQGFPFTAVGATLTFLYLLSMYLWNSLTSIDITRHLGLGRYRFYNAHKRLLFGLALICISLLLGISYAYSRHLFYLMLIPTAAGSLYHFTIVPRKLRRFTRYSNLKDIPTSRDLFVALAWAVLITFIPHAIRGGLAITASTVLFFIWTFFLAFLRSLLFDLRDIEGDRIMGRETLVTIIGEKRVRKTIFFILALSPAVLVAYSVFQFWPSYPRVHSHAAAFAFQALVVVYLWLFMRSKALVLRDHPRLFNILADLPFFVAGFAAWLARAAGI